MRRLSRDSDSGSLTPDPWVTLQMPFTPGFALASLNSEGLDWSPRLPFSPVAKNS